MKNDIVTVRVKGADLGNHKRLGSLVKGAIHKLPRNEVGAELFDILEIEYKGSLRSKAEILALHRRAKKADKKVLAGIIAAREIKKGGVSHAFRS